MKTHGLCSNVQILTHDTSLFIVFIAFCVPDMRAKKVRIQPEVSDRQTPRAVEAFLKRKDDAKDTESTPWEIQGVGVGGCAYFQILWAGPEQLVQLLLSDFRSPKVSPQGL